MYNISDSNTKSLVYSALSSPTREFKNRISFGEGVGARFTKRFDVARGIKTLNISQEGNSNGDGLVFGCCCCSSAVAEFYNPDKTYNYANKTMFVECGIKLSDGSYFYIPCGYFKIDKPETEDEWATVKVTAYDDVDRMTEKWNTNLSMPSNAYLLFKEIADEYNLELDITTSLVNEMKARTITEADALTLTSYTKREVCGFLAGLFAGNARINTVGKLAVKRYTYGSEDGFEVSLAVQWQNGFKKKSEQEFEINSITSGIGDNVFTAGTGKGISFANPIITQDEIEKIYQNYQGFTFQPSDCEWRGNPCYECHDTIYVYDKSENSCIVYIARQDIDLAGGLSMVTRCPNGDADISFDTVNEQIRAALNKQYTDLQQAIVDATNKINGALGGYYEVLDSDKDGNPDGWLIKEFEDGSGGLIRANKAGIGLSEDGGKTYRTAITYKGINADEITSGKVKAEFIEAEKLMIGKGNVDGLADELNDIIDVANTASSNASTASQNASATALKLGAVTAEQNGVVYVKGSTILAGSIGVDQLASGSVTADKIDSTSVTAEVITTGTLRSKNRVTYFDLDNAKLVTQTATAYPRFSFEYSGGGLKGTYSANDYTTTNVGGIRPTKFGTTTESMVTWFNKALFFVKTPDENLSNYDTFAQFDGNSNTILMNKYTVFGDAVLIGELSQGVYINPDGHVETISPNFTAFTHTRSDDTNKVYGKVKVGVGNVGSVSAYLGFSDYSLYSSTNKVEDGKAYYAVSMAQMSFNRLTKWVSVPPDAKSFNVSFDADSYGHAYFYFAYKTKDQVNTNYYQQGTFLLKVETAPNSYNGTVTLPSDAAQWAIGIVPDSAYQDYWAGWRNVSISYKTPITSAALELRQGAGANEKTTARIDVYESQGAAIGEMAFTANGQTSPNLGFASDDLWYKGVPILSRLKDLEERISALE